MKIFTKTVIVILVVVGLFALTPTGQYIFAAGNDLYRKLEVFQEMIQLINTQYVEPVDWDSTMEGAFKGLMDALDPHSIFIPPDRVDNINESFKGNFEGIGIEFDILNDYITVISPIVGSPSDGLLNPGDQLIKIDGESAYKITRDEVFKKLRGPKGSKVGLSVARAGLDELLEITIIRDKIPIYSVLAKFLMDDDSTGYLLMNRFSATTSNEFITAVEELKTQGMKQLLVDIRYNSGGYLDEVVKIIDDFLPGGEKIVYTRGRLKNANEDYFSTGKAEFEKLPVMIMINRASASASEILSGSLQDLDRALIVGETSFGKGLVQRQYPMRDGSAIRVTVAKYFTPSGRLIQRPYKNGDAEAYYEEIYDHDFDKVDSTKLASRPIYHTKTGRVVYGGGGITPDVHLAPPGVLTKSTANIRRHSSRPFFTYASEYAVKHPELKRDWEHFYDNFKYSEDELNQFYSIIDSLGIKIDRLELTEDENIIQNYLKSELAAQLWGRNEQYEVRTELDDQIQEAMQHWTEAREIGHAGGYH